MSLRTRILQWFAELELHALQAESVAEARMVATSSLPRLIERFFEVGESAASHDSGERLHDFRIQAKKLRYTLELFVPMYGPEMEQRIQRIKSVQSVLGRMNDYRSVLVMAMEAGCGKEPLFQLVPPSGVLRMWPSQVGALQSVPTAVHLLNSVHEMLESNAGVPRMLEA